MNELKPHDRHSAGAIDRDQEARLVDDPRPCFVRMRLVPNGVWLAARIFHRMGALVGEINGSEADIYQIWHSGNIIPEEQYWRMMEHPEPNPRRIIHISTAGLTERARDQALEDWFETRPLGPALSRDV
jgi:hypothetical protein